jgi:glycosyltransferase involved in cell wall biosynthesis
MKIVILQDHLRAGGTETQVLELGNRWLAAGHDVRLVVFRPGGELAETKAAQRLQPVALQKRDWRLDWHAPKLRETVAGLQPDVVVAFGREANAKLPKLDPDAAWVATVRSGRDQPQRFWRGLKAADAVVANSRWAERSALAQGVEKIRSQVIYSGLAHEPLTLNPEAARATWRERAGAAEDTLVMLCVAGFRVGKGQDILLRAATQLEREPRWQLWLAGDGPMLKLCKALAIELNLQKTVRFTGRVKEPAQLYAAADLGVLASEAESLPNFILEAQAAGLPVVTTEVGGIEEGVDEGKTGRLVPPNDIGAMAAMLGKTLRDADWREKAKAPAQERARKLFDPVKNAERWLGLFGDLVAKGR